MLSFYRAMKKWDCLRISYEPMRRQTCCWWPYTLPVKSFGYFCLSKFPWSDQTLKKMHNLWKTYVYSLQSQTGLLPIHDFTWDKWSHHTLFLLADKSQWLKRTKMKVSKSIHWYIYTTTVLSYWLCSSSGQKAPLHCIGGSLNGSLKSLCRRKRIWGMRKKSNQCCVHGWHCTRFMTFFYLFNMHNPYGRT